MPNLKKQIQKIYQFFLDTIFPIKCLGCGKEGEWLCPDCLSSIELLKDQLCPKCGKPSKNGKFCPDCSIKSKMTGILVGASYDDELLKKAIHVMKYNFVKGLAEPLSGLLMKTLKKNSQFSILNSEFLIIPVPLHLKRLKWRGFNQAFELAWCLEKNLDLEVKKDILIRSKYAKPQMQIKHHLARRKNIKNAFECVKPDEVKNKTIILIDDVCTTSATLEECAKALSLAKPKEIWGLVLARVK